jgi:hypothetical protein
MRWSQIGEDPEENGRTTQIYLNGWGFKCVYIIFQLSPQEIFGDHDYLDLLQGLQKTKQY